MDAAELTSEQREQLDEIDRELRKAYREIGNLGRLVPKLEPNESASVFIQRCIVFGESCRVAIDRLTLLLSRRNKLLHIE